MDDLMDHDLAKLELFMLLIIKVLRDHSNALVIASNAAAAISMTVLVVIVAIQGANPGSLADTTISLSPRAVVFLTEPEGLQEQENGDLDEGK